jgi:anti-anti-sigma factor
MNPLSDIYVHFDDHQAAVMTLCGEFDLATLDRLNDCLAELIDAKPATLVVDMAAVTFFDWVSMTALIRASQEVKAQGRSIVVSRPPRIVRRILEITGLAPTFAVDPGCLDEGSTHLNMECAP